MLDIELLKNVLIISIAGGCVSTLLIQKIKENLNTKNWLLLISFLVNMIIGTLFAMSFSNVNLKYCIWTGLFGFVDSNVLYAMFEDKIFKSFSKIKENDEVLTDTIMDVPQDDNEDKAVG